MFIKIFLIGWLILIFAVLINIFAIYLRIDTWYSFIEETRSVGLYRAFFNLSIASKLFLFFIYPSVLGFSAYIALKFIK